VIRNKRERRKVMQAVYGDSLTERGGWVDLDRIDAEVEALLEHDPAQAERFFLNRKLASEGAAFDFEKWLEKARKRKAPPKGHADRHRCGRRPERRRPGCRGLRGQDGLRLAAGDLGAPT
jgi:hypothetical protein